MTAQVFRRTINGAPYDFGRNDRGWRVQAVGSPTDNFHRTYQVIVGKDGRPQSCSCPSCHRRKTPEAIPDCKHMREVTRIWLESHPWDDAQLIAEAARCGHYSRPGS